MHGTVLQNPSEAWTGSTIITGVLYHSMQDICNFVLFSIVPC